MSQVPEDDALAQTMIAGQAQGQRAPGDIFAPGDVLSSAYQIRSRIGVGGFGQVYEALDLLLNRRVAVKAAVQQPGAPSLRQEAVALAAVSDPGVVTVYAMGLHQGVEYIVMERVFGESLAAHLEHRRKTNARMSVAQAVDVLLPVASALVAVHRAGIAHRDLKPGNLMLSARGRVILMDFGIFLPHVLVKQGADEVIAGSPDYMAPEVITATVRPGAAHLVDLYALGVMAFEMLAGAVPYSAKALPEVLRKHLQDPVPDLCKIRSDVPAPLGALVSELLAKHPLSRPQTADIVVQRLRQGARDTAPVELKPISVLIVDDDAETLSAYSNCARQAAPNVDVRTAPSGERALEMIREKTPDLMFVDLQMPGMSGFEVAMVLRGSNEAEKLTVVPVSGRSEHKDVRVLRSLGFTNFVTKGNNALEEIASIVRETRRVIARRAG